MNDHDRPTIEHVSNEKRPGNGLWWFLWAVIVFGWATYLWGRSPDWHSIALGAASAFVLAAWATDITGNKVPDSWRRNR